MEEPMSHQMESDYAASPNVVSGVPITVARIGAYVRDSATSTQTVPNSTWVSDLTNNTTNPAFSFAGVVHEIIIFDRSLTEMERDNVYGYLSRKYRLNEKLPDRIKTTQTGTRFSGMTYWQVESHPNTKGITGYTFGREFGDISIRQFLYTPKQFYRSIGTPLPDGTTLGGDTYTNLF